MKNSSNNKLKKLQHYADGGANSWYEYFMLVVIAVNTVSLGLETMQNLSELSKKILYWIDQTCLWLFVVELIFKFIVYNKDFFGETRPDENGKMYFHINSWNILDLVIVLVSVFSSFSYFAVFRVFRIINSIRIAKTIRSLRIIKSLKFISEWHEFRSILKALMRAIPRILWIFLLLFLFEYIYAVIGTNIFCGDFPDYFGSLGRSLLTLLQVVTFDSWISQIARPIILTYPAACIYFISYPFITAYILLNLIIGIIVDSIKDERKSRKKVTLEKLSAQITALQQQIRQMENDKKCR